MDGGSIMTEYDEIHGGPFDRGSADSYYRRPPEPHYYPQGTYTGPRIEEHQMTPEQIKAYCAGFDDNEANGVYKEW